jgi:glycosyltransferase involved in cell wall biosynthesis
MSDRVLNVCFVAPLPPQYGANGHSCGGIGHWTRMVCNYAKNRNDVLITVIDTTPRWRSTHDFSIWQRALSGGSQFLLYIVKLCLLLLTQRIDVIHLTTSGQLGIVRDLGIIFIAQMFRIPIIYHIRFGRIPHIAVAKSREWRMIARAIMKAHTVIAIDKATRDAIDEHLPAANVVLIPNCINFSDLSPVSITKSLKRTVLFAGWIIPTKGIAELVEAWALIKPDGWRLQIVGPGDAAYQQTLIEQYQPDEIEFLGEMPHSQTIELMAACELFVLPSYTEGFPNAVLEAMALGKPIVATDVGAIPEMLDGMCGQLVKSKDVPSLKTALQLLFNDSHLRTEMGCRAKKKAAENYSIEVVFGKYMALWCHAINQD